VFTFGQHGSCKSLNTFTIKTGLNNDIVNRCASSNASLDVAWAHHLVHVDFHLPDLGCQRGAEPRLKVLTCAPQV
jgi:hypothetical protein